MSKSLRALSVLLFLAASFAYASTDNGGYLGEGGMPSPDVCRPGQVCMP